ncbi:class I SAM-dependent methyltransferase [Candidatus Uhrbacteria bacterium]|nr:class I SAM-dependent methyltransferase [Candidatus Uhrbacteria bacterium]
MDRDVYRALDELNETHWWFLGRRAVVSDILSRLPQFSGRRILDIGSGAGGMIETLLPHGTVTAAEGDSASREALQKRFGERVRVLPGFLGDIDLAGHDVITMFDVLEHIEDDRAALRAIWDALPSGGRFICTVPAFKLLWSGHDVMSHHFRRYARAELIRKLTETGFVIERVTFFNFFLFPAILALRLVFRALGRKDSDFNVPAPFVNGILARIFSAERFLLRHMNLPWGVSLLVVARKPE